MRTAAHIIETVGKLVKKYDTRDPYELCKCLEIKIHFYNLEKKLKGFFFYQSRQKNIVIDSNVNDVLERYALNITQRKPVKVIVLHGRGNGHGAEFKRQYRENKTRIRRKLQKSSIL